MELNPKDKEKDMRPIYSVIFEDKDRFVGGNSYTDTKWLAIPNKKISTIFYLLPHGTHLCLSSFDKFYHMVEATQDINGKNKGKEKIEFVHVMGKKSGKVIDYKIDLYNKVGNITVTEYKENDNFIQALNKDGWK